MKELLIPGLLILPHRVYVLLGQLDLATDLCCRLPDQRRNSVYAQGAPSDSGMLTYLLFWALPSQYAVRAAPAGPEIRTRGADAFTASGCRHGILV